MPGSTAASHLQRGKIALFFKDARSVGALGRGSGTAPRMMWSMSSLLAKSCDSEETLMLVRHIQTQLQTLLCFTILYLSAFPFLTLVTLA